MPRLGARKLQVKLAENDHDIGRDKLFNLLRESGLLVSSCLPVGINPFGRHFSILNFFNRKKQTFKAPSTNSHPATAAHTDAPPISTK